MVLFLIIRFATVGRGSQNISRGEQTVEDNVRLESLSCWPLGDAVLTTPPRQWSHVIIVSLNHVILELRLIA
jgi:hypothetical protein